MKRSLVLVAAVALVAVALASTRKSRAPDPARSATATAEGPVAPQGPAPHRASGPPSAATAQGEGAVAAPRAPGSAAFADGAGGAPGRAPVDLEATGVIERLARSRHGFLEPRNPNVAPGQTFRFTLARGPLVELARRHEAVAWPVLDGESENVRLDIVREQDGNLFLSGDLVDGPGQFVLVMGPDDSVTAQLTSSDGLYSYGSQRDEIVAQRVEGPLHID